MTGLFHARLRSAAAAAALLASQALAQTLDQHSFGFKFASSTFSDIVQCDVLPLSAIPVNTTSTYLGQPPYTVLTFKAGGVPDAQDGGSNSTNIPWQVRHEPGSRIFLTVIDANGDYAGFPKGYYTVVPGSSKACMPTLPTGNVLPKLTANVTNTDLKTCQPWGMTITGGLPPYSVQIIADDSPVYTNTTAPSTVTDRFTYINRADPGRTMIVAVSDATGRFGYSTEPVFTRGSTNTSCPGLSSSWRPAAAVAKEMEDDRERDAARAANQRRMTIIGAVVGVLCFILLCIGAFFLWRKIRKARTVRKGQPGFDMEPVAAFFPPAADGTTTTTTMSPAFPMRQASAHPSTFTTHDEPYPPLRRNPSAVSGAMSYGSSYSQRDELPPLPGEFDPYSLISPNPPGSRARLGKADEAAMERRAALTHEASVSQPGTPFFPPGAHPPPGSLPGSLRRGPSSSVTSPSSHGASVVGTDSDSGAIILQHRDGGAPPMVVELPPAYDNTRGPSFEAAQGSSHNVKH
ncbi:hypothetical protein AURDEDRAFT_113764 [Auricularia subglabra TFB-10046 SS5]|nr:hypothetical protein AURDEDRAFT_113764 [Auricularia subglabra TFB-10046 SS5]